jgi:hypothetical protein
MRPSRDSTSYSPNVSSSNKYPICLRSSSSSRKPGMNRSVTQRGNARQVMCPGYLFKCLMLIWVSGGGSRYCFGASHCLRH